MRHWCAAVAARIIGWAAGFASIAATGCGDEVPIKSTSSGQAKKTPMSSTPSESTPPKAGGLWARLFGMKSTPKGEPASPPEAAPTPAPTAEAAPAESPDLADLMPVADADPVEAAINE